MGNKPKNFIEASNHKKPLRARKIMGIPIGWMILIIGSFVTTGALIGIAFNFSIIQTTSVQTQGVYTPEMYFDGVVMDQAQYDAPSDIFSDGVLEAAEAESFSHTLMSPVTDGDWDVAWNVQEFMTWFHTPTDPSYGYVFNVTDQTGTNISYMTVMHGETKTIEFVHSLNSHFDQGAAPVGGIPFKLALHVYPYVMPPTATDDSFMVVWRTATPIYPLLNDVGSPLTITSVSAAPGGSIATIDPTGQFITYYKGSVNQETITYTICTGAPLYKMDTGTIILNS